MGSKLHRNATAKGFTDHHDLLRPDTVADKPIISGERIAHQSPFARASRARAIAPIGQEEHAEALGLIGGETLAPVMLRRPAP